MKIRLTILFIAAAFLDPGISSSQTSQADDSVILEKAYHVVLSSYRKSIGYDAAIFNGREYIQYNPRIKGSPLYLDKSFDSASIFYDGTLYNGYTIQFDLVQQALILAAKPGDAPIRLINEKVGYFYLDSQLFVPANFQQGAVAGGTQFYHQLYKGSVSAFCYHRKQIIETRNRTDPSVFKQYDDYYIQIKNTVYPVSTNRNFLNLLPAHREELKNFLRKNQINFKRKPSDLARVAEYYDQFL